MKPRKPRLEKQEPLAAEPSLSLAQELRRRGLVQERLAESLSLSPSYVSLICGGKRVPSIQTGKRIADYLGVSLDEFYRLMAGGRR